MSDEQNQGLDGQPPIDEAPQGRPTGLRGKLPARHVPEISLDRFRLALASESLPAAFDITGGLQNWGMLGNDQYGDCGPAAIQHLRISGRKPFQCTHVSGT